MDVDAGPPRYDDWMIASNLRRRALAEMESAVAAFDWSRLTDGRRQILEAFLSVATAEGYTSVSMRTLGARLNVKAPTLYSHFPGGKDELVSMALRWRFDQWASGAIDALRPTDGPEEYFDALVDYYVRNQLVTVDNEMFDLLLASDRYAANLPDSTRRESARFVLLTHELVSGGVADLGHQDPHYAAGIIISLLDSVRTWSRPFGDGDDLDARVAEARSIVDAILDRVDVLDESLAQAPARSGV